MDIEPIPTYKTAKHYSTHSPVGECSSIVDGDGSWVGHIEEGRVRGRPGAWNGCSGTGKVPVDLKQPLRICSKTLAVGSHHSHLLDLKRKEGELSHRMVTYTCIYTQCDNSRGFTTPTSRCKIYDNQNILIMLAPFVTV